MFVVVCNKTCARTWTAALFSSQSFQRIISTWWCRCCCLLHTLGHIINSHWQTYLNKLFISRDFCVHWILISSSEYNMGQKWIPFKSRANVHKVNRMDRRHDYEFHGLWVGCEHKPDEKLSSAFPTSFNHLFVSKLWTKHYNTCQLLFISLNKRTALFHIIRLYSSCLRAFCCSFKLRILIVLCLWRFSASWQIYRA